MLTSQARRFAQSLLRRHALTKEAYNDAVTEAGRTGEPLDVVITRRVDIGPKDLAYAFAVAAGVDFVDLDEAVIQLEAHAALPAEVVKTYPVLGLGVEGRTLTVAFPMPADGDLMHEVTEALAEVGYDLEPVGTEPVELSRVRARLAGEAIPAAAVVTKVEERLIGLIDRTIELGGSDLHLAADEPPFLRILGQLIRLPDHPPLTAAEVRDMAMSMISPRQRERFDETRELDTAYAIPGRARLRVNLFVQRGVIGAALRIIPYEVIPFESIGIPSVVASFAGLPRGLVLVTGPTGSGKSTTLAALIDLVNEHRPAHVLTIEDPIEFVHRSKMALVNQREVGDDTGGFHQALGAALREDPDVILVGEMRDLETISTAITAAETGHLVFATLHTQDSGQTIDRIVDVFPASQQAQIRIQLANTLQGIVAQQLIPTADGRRRVPACEVLIANPALRVLIREGKVHQIPNTITAGRKMGMQTLDAALVALVRSGEIVPEEALKRARDAHGMATALGLTA